MFQEFTGVEYLKINIANSYGNDKMNWDDRLAWFEENKNNLEKCLDEADEPAMFYASVRALEAVYDNKPIGFPISLDATSSGLQLLSVVTGDRLASELCNVVDVGERRDAYTYIYQYMKGKYNLAGNISRADAKTAIMTALYCSKAEPKRIFGRAVDSFYETMATLAPCAWHMNLMFEEFWNSSLDIYEWELPDLFNASFKVEQTIYDDVVFNGITHEVSRKRQGPTDTGRSLGANLIHSLDGLGVRELTARCNFDHRRVHIVDKIIRGETIEGEYINEKDGIILEQLVRQYEKTNFFSARVIDHINSDNVSLVPMEQLVALRESMPKKSFQLMSIHDCFRCLPNYGNDLRRQYNQFLAELHNSDVLSNILSDAIKKEVSIDKLDSNMYSQILEANYALS